MDNHFACLTQVVWTATAQVLPLMPPQRPGRVVIGASEYIF